MNAARADKTAAEADPNDAGTYPAYTYPGFGTMVEMKHRAVGPLPLRGQAGPSSGLLCAAQEARPSDQGSPDEYRAPR